jgi:diacylglycerol kinase (ATP)
VQTVYSGLRYAVLYDFSVTYKLLLSVVLLSAAFSLREWIDVILVMLVTGLVLVAEIFNSAIETLCDFVEENHNEKIKMIKDISAAAVGVTIAMWFVVLCVEVFQMVQVLR